MEAKKNPSCDVGRYRGVIFGGSLALSLALTILAFEWTTTKITRITDTFDEPTLDWTMDAPQVEIPKPKIPASNTPPASRVVLAVAPEIEEIKASAKTELIFADSIFAPVALIDTPEENVPDLPVSFAEVMPSPEGGLKKFYEVIGKNIRYPRSAISASIEGKVFVQFTVQADGTLGEWKILKGIGFGCDEEAIRVLGLTRWMPGRQGGKKVPVRMVQPIVFKIP